MCATGPRVDRVGVEVERGLRAHELAPECQQALLEVAQRRRTLRGTQSDRQDIGLESESCDHAVEMLPQRQAEISFQAIPRLRRGEIIRVEAGSRRHPVADLAREL